MKFSYNWLQSFFSKPLPKPEKLGELLTMRSFQVEEVAKKGDDYILDIDILPNRASDCLSHYGIARECSALLNVKCQMSNVPEGKPSASDEVHKSSSKPKAQNKKVLEVKIAGMCVGSKIAA